MIEWQNDLPVMILKRVEGIRCRVFKILSQYVCGGAEIPMNIRSGYPVRGRK
jgi:hypothetical protein